MLKSPLRLKGHGTVIIPIRPKFCIDITSMPKEAVVVNSTVALAVTCQSLETSGGNSMAMGEPKNGWFMEENPIYRWMMTRGNPILGNNHLNVLPRTNAEVTELKKPLRFV